LKANLRPKGAGERADRHDPLGIGERREADHVGEDLGEPPVAFGACIDGAQEQKVAVAEREARAVDLLQRAGQRLEVDQPGMRLRLDAADGGAEEGEVSPVPAAAGAAGANKGPVRARADARLAITGHGGSLDGVGAGGGVATHLGPVTRILSKTGLPVKDYFPLYADF